MTRLEQAKLFLDFYFAPWGAAKGEAWEIVTHDSPFEDDFAALKVRNILEGSEELSEEDIKLIKIVTG